MSALRALPGPQRGEPRRFLPVVRPDGGAGAFRRPGGARGFRRLAGPLALLDPAGAGRGLPGLAGRPRSGPAAVTPGAAPSADPTELPGPRVLSVSAPCLRTRCRGLLASARHGLWRSLVSASVWGTEGREFKSPQPDKQELRSTLEVLQGHAPRHAGCRDSRYLDI